MNEKTKRIISYIGCALGGMALGIALLGGLSFCSVREKAEQTNVNTILSKPKAEQINTGTTGGNYTGYRFEIPRTISGTPEAGSYYARYYTMDVSTYTPTLYSQTDQTYISATSSDEVIDIIDNHIATLLSNQSANEFGFLVLEGAYQTDTAYREFAYLSFINRISYQSLKPFVLTNKEFQYSWKRSTTTWGTRYETGDLFILNQTLNDVVIMSMEEGGFLADTTPYIFQDVASYYQELGYQDGYDEGETTGYNSGYEVGYSDGSETGRMFTALGLNQTTWYKSDLTPTSTSETSNFYKLLEFKDGDNEEWGVAAELFTTDDLFKVDLYKNINQGYTSATYYGTLGEGTMTYVSGVWQVEMTPATYYFYEWAQITEVYNNSLPLNYFLLTGTPQNATGYQQGYQAGYQAGILATPGGEATNNVFSLFTSAFDSVGGFFNLKIFGFLPLYWFFLAPLFVALITLLLRMVKH